MQLGRRLETKPDHKQLRVRFTEHPLQCLTLVLGTISKRSPLIHQQHEQLSELGTIITGCMLQVGE